jgi:hypothetical protein
MPDHKELEEPSSTHVSIPVFVGRNLLFLQDGAMSHMSMLKSLKSTLPKG